MKSCSADQPLHKLDRLTQAVQTADEIRNDSANCYKSLVYHPHRRRLATVFPAKSHLKVLILGGN
jgi:prolyl-tRNA editing enzyme YbaK/EbsC (Cys-tRNA(Pro) deacylase)